MEKKFGVLEFWDSARAFGFIRVTDSEGCATQYFLHVSRIISGEPQPGAGVRFAVDVQPVVKKRIEKRPTAIEAEVGDILPKFLPQRNALKLDNAGGGQ
jgi:cold shock CspA family protein